MVENVDFSKCLPAPQVSGFMPGNPHRATVHTYMTNGVKVGNKTVKLKSVLCGTRRFVHPDWIADFIRECNPDLQLSPTVNASQRTQQAEAAMRVLAAN